MNYLDEFVNFIPSDFRNPFDVRNIRKIELEIGKGWNSGEMEFKSRVSFTDGDSSGYHNIKGSNFKDLIFKTQSFIKEMSGK